MPYDLSKLNSEQKRELIALLERKLASRTATATPNLARDYTTEPVADVTKDVANIALTEPRFEPFGVLPKGSAEKIVPPIERKPVQGRWWEKIGAVASNAAIDLRDMIGLIPHTLENPIQTGKGFLQMTPEAMKNLARLTVNPNPATRAEAVEAVGQSPLGFLFGLAPFAKLAGGKPKIPVKKTAVESAETIVPQATLLEKIVEKPAEVAPEIQRPPAAKEPWQMTRAEFESQGDVVYHGGSGEYRVTTDRGAKATGNPTGAFGAFFTPSRMEAQRYVNDFHAKKGAVNVAKVDLKNPYQMPFTEMDKIIGVDWKKLGLEEGMNELTAKVNAIKADLISKGHDGIIVGTPGKMRAQEVVAFNDNAIIQHKYAVEQALASGKPIPPEVLADYPDLKPGTELRYAGVTPDVLAEPFRKFFGRKGEEGGRRAVNILGTPEVVLEGRGIVEPFQDAKIRYEGHRKQIADRLGGILGEVVKDKDARSEWFTKLDDPSIELTGKQFELRQYLDEMFRIVNEHRVARGQSEIPYRKGYITHLIDQMDQTSTVFQDVKIPKTLKFAFEKRKGATGYKTDVVEAVEAYTDAALRDIYYSDALYQAIPKVEALNKQGGRPIISKKVITSPDGKTTEIHFYNLGDAPFFSERRYAEEFIKAQLGWPTASEKAVHGALDIKPQTQQAAMQGVTQTFYKSLLGAALDTGVKNLTQGTNLIADAGYVPAMRGYAKLLTGEGIKAASHEHLLQEFEPLLQSGASGRFFGVKATGKLGRAGIEFDKWVLSSPMRFSEFVNRGASFHAYLDEGVRKGMSIEQAHDYAVKQVRKVQFGYGKLDTSPYLRGAFTKPFVQFTSYPIKQAELMARWAREPGGRGKLLRYFATTGALIVGGTYAGVEIGSTFLNPLKMVDPESNEGIQLPGSDKRVDISWDKFSESGFIPQGPAPVISAPLNFVKSQMSEDQYTREYGRRKGLEMLIPGGRYGGKVLRAIDELQTGERTGARGRVNTKPTTKDVALGLAGFRSTDAEVAESKRTAVVEAENYYYQARKNFIDAFIAKDRDEAKRVVTELREKYPFLYKKFMKGMSLDAIMEEAKKKQMTSEQRFFDPDLRKEILIGLRKQ